MARVCFVRLGATPLFHESEASFGGAEVRAYRFAEGLARASNHQVSFAVRAANGLPSVSPSGRIRLHAMPRRTSPWSKLYSSMMGRLTDGPPLYRPVASIDADIFACFGVHAPTAGVVAAAKSRGRRSLLFLASAEAVRDLDSPTPRELRHRRMYEYAIRNADVIIAQTEFQRGEILARYGRPSALIRNPIEIPTRATAPGVRENVLWIGRADRDSKRADLCIEVAKRCPGIPFVLVMNETCQDLFRDLIADLPANVTLLRRVPLEQTHRLFQSASVLINTSDSEGFPNTFLQAAAHGVPIVSLRVDPDGMLSQHRCGIVAGTLARMCELTSLVHQGELKFDATALRHYVATYHELSGRIQQLDRLISNLVSSKVAA